MDIFLVFFSIFYKKKKNETRKDWKCTSYDVLQTLQFSSGHSMSHIFISFTKLRNQTPTSKSAQKSFLRNSSRNHECSPNLERLRDFPRRRNVGHDPRRRSVCRVPFSPSSEHRERARRIEEIGGDRPWLILSPSPELNPPVAESDRGSEPFARRITRARSVYVWLGGALMPR